MKEGWKTTEFWLTLGAQVIPLLVLTGILSNQEATAVQDAWAKAVEAVFAFIASVVPIAVYVYGRAKVKAGK